MEYVFGCGKFGLRKMYVETFLVIKVLLCLICVGNDYRETGEQLKALLKIVFKSKYLCLVIVLIKRQHSPCKVVHNVAARYSQYHILGEIIRQHTH